MSWFFVALIGSFLYAVTNHIDKYVISKYLQNSGLGSLVIFSSIFSIFALPFIWWIHPTVFSVTLIQGVVLATTGMLTIGAILLYFYALQEDEATNVVPLYQTIPIFAFLLGYLILGEVITTMQVVAACTIIMGAAVLSFKIGDGVIRFKRTVVLYMLSASALYAMSSVLFKLVALEEGFWLSTFWSLVGKVILGLFFLTAVPIYRRQFFLVIQENKARVLALNSLNESFSICADALMGFATLLAPVVLVLLVEAFQPVFVLIIGVTLTLFFPHISAESITRKHIFQKVGAIGCIVLGSVLLAL